MYIRKYVCTYSYTYVHKVCMYVRTYVCSCTHVLGIQSCVHLFGIFHRQSAIIQTCTLYMRIMYTYVFTCIHIMHTCVHAL